MTKNKSKWLIIMCLCGASLLFANTAYIQVKAIFAQHFIAQAWEETLQKNKVMPSPPQQRLADDNKKPQDKSVNHRTITIKPWSWADTYPVAKLTIKEHDIEQYILAGASGSPLAFAPGLYAGTQLPSGYTTTLPDAVIAGHHNTHFDFLKVATIGNSVQLQNAQGKIFTYQVTAIDTYDIRTQRLPSYTKGETLQLVTCKPAFIGEINPPLRLVATAQLMSTVN